jgi:hypothetical protein
MNLGNEMRAQEPLLLVQLLLFILLKTNPITH